MNAGQHYNICKSNETIYLSSHYDVERAQMILPIVGTAAKKKEKKKKVYKSIIYLSISLYIYI